MNPLELLAQPFWQHGTWALIHFLWQGCVIALVYRVLLGAIEWRSAAARYWLGLGALAVMALAVPATFVWLAGSASSAAGDHSLASEVAVIDLASGQELTAAPESLVARIDRLIVSLQPWLAAAWLAGVAGFGLRLLASFAGVMWLAESARELPADLMKIAHRVARRLGLGEPVNVFLSERVAQAAAIGFLRPLVLLPAAWAAQLDAATLEAVIAHELAHVQRWDLWVNLLQRCLETLLFYHPAVWWLSSQVRAEREMCCDEMAAEASGDRAGYVAALVTVAQVQVARQQAAACAPLLGAGMGGENMALLTRVRYVLGLSSEGENGRWWPVGLAALALPAVIWGATIGLTDRAAVAEEGASEKQGAEAIDRYVEARLTQADLIAKDNADRATLSRRLYLDMTGALPTKAELEAILHDDSEGAYDRLVVRLLAAKDGDDDGDRKRDEKEGARKDGDKVKEGARKEGDKPKEGVRKEGERREGDKVKEGNRKEGDRPKEERKDGEGKNVEQARAALQAFEAEAREAISRAKSDEERQAIKEKLAQRYNALQAASKEAAAKEGVRKEGDKPKEGERRELTKEERAKLAYLRTLKERETTDGARAKIEGALKERHAELDKVRAALEAEMSRAKTDDERREIKERLAGRLADLQRAEAEAQRAQAEKAREHALRALAERKEEGAKERGLLEDAIQAERIQREMAAKEHAVRVAEKRGEQNAELMTVVQQLRDEVARLRAEVNELRGQKGELKKEPLRKDEVRKEKGDFEKREGDRKPEKNYDRKPEKGDAERAPEKRNLKLESRDEERKEGDRKPEKGEGGRK